MKIMIALCTCPDAAVAERIATTLVEESLAACVNRLPAVTSTYRWLGKICHDDEHLLLIKTTRERFAAVRDRILCLHPYELPEIIGLDVTAGLDPYLDWVEAQTHIGHASRDTL
jgi:periplasmic divalent cation tolerance protein